MPNIRYLLAIPLAVVVCALALTASSQPTLEDALKTQEALALERPNDARVFNDLGNLLLLQRETERAQEAYEKALSLDSTMASAHFNLGLLHQQRGRINEAMNAYRETIKVAPEHAWAHYQIGSLLEAKGKTRRAVKAYARAFQLDPDLSFADVNAHVIDSELTERALLVAFGGAGNKPAAPNVYQQPERIVALMVPAAVGLAEAPEVEVASDQDSDAMTAEDEDAKPTQAQTVAPMPRSLPQVDENPDKDDEEGGEGRVIRARDLDGRSGLNQAVKGTGSRGSSNRYRPGTSQQPTRTWARPANPSTGSAFAEGKEPPVRVIDPSGRTAGSNQARPNNGRNQNQTQGGNGGRVRYRPGVNSTGSLQIDLMPLAPADEIPEVAPAG